MGLFVNYSEWVYALVIWYTLQLHQIMELLVNLICNLCTRMKFKNSHCHMCFVAVETIFAVPQDQTDLVRKQEQHLKLCLCETVISDRLFSLHITMRRVFVHSNTIHHFHTAQSIIIAMTNSNVQLEVPRLPTDMEHRQRQHYLNIYSKHMLQRWQTSTQAA